ncbi:MAG: protein kinase [Coriobacteriia bacterium]
MMVGVADRIGPYELRGELGRGAMAVVWRAWDTSLRREVALKEAHIPHGTSLATATELSDRFVREARAVASLSHPNIVTLYAADVYDGRPVIAMELIEGDTLADLLARGRLPVHAALGILEQLLDAVGYAHSKGVVHRDIKPENVFVTPDGRVKLTDFGIAHVGSGTALTQAGTVMGTPGYMAPEQVTGSAVDGRADIFSTGVLAYEMLTGSNPFIADGAHPTTVMYRVLNEDLPDVRQTLPDTSEGVAATIAVATAKNPARRFTTAEDMKAALCGDVALAMPKAARAGESGEHTPTTSYLVVGAVVLMVIALAGFWVFGASGPGGSGGSGTGSVAATAAVTATVTAAAAPARPPAQDPKKQPAVAAPLPSPSEFTEKASQAPVAATSDGKSFTFPRIDIVAEVRPDGSMRITERRAFKFVGDFTRVYWLLDTTGSDGIEVISASVDNVLARRADSSAAERPAGTYAVTDLDGKVEVSVFHRSNNETREFEIVYVVSGAATRWADTAEVQWDFIGDQWGAGANDTRIDVRLPGGASGANVRAWGEGPKQGRVSIDQNGTVSLVAPSLAPNQAVTGRIVFPQEALSQTPQDPKQALARILGEESQ